MLTDTAIDDFLSHHGVKGMHWGSRKDKRWAKKTLSQQTYFKVYNHAADKMNNGLIDQFNNRPEWKKVSGPRVQNEKYVHDYEQLFAKTMSESLNEMGKGVSPSGQFKAGVHHSPGADLPTIVIVDTHNMAHAADMSLDFVYDLVLDKDGYIVAVKKTQTASDTIQQSFDALDDVLAHFGVKGMHWGVRHDPSTGASKSVNRMAAKHAKEHARAKLFYGDGAGNRRKLIKAKVEYNRKHVPGYSAAFDYHSSEQNLSEHATKASKERTSIDRKDRNKKRVGAVARRITGEWGTQAAFVALATTGAAFAASPKGRALFQKSTAKINNKFNDQKSDFDRKRNAKRIQDMLDNMK